MKKLVLLFFFALISAASFAEGWDKMISAGLGAPIYNQLGSSRGVCGDYGLSYRGLRWNHAFGTSLDLQGRFVSRNSNFALLVGAELDFLAVNSKYFIHGGDDTMDGAAFNFHLGVGNRMVNTEKFQLIFSPLVLSTTFAAFDADIPVNHEGTLVDGKVSSTTVSINLGMDLFASYQLSKHLCIAGSLGVDFGLLGLNVFSVEYTGAYENENDDNDTWNFPVSVLVTPKISLVYKF